MVTAVLALALSVPVGLAPVAQADEPGPGVPAAAEQRVSKVRAIDTPQAKSARERVATAEKRNDAQAASAAAARQTSWPKGGRATVDLTAGASDRQSGAANPGGLPVTIRPTGKTAAVGKAHIQVLDQKVAQTAGVRGVVFTVRTDSPGTAKVDVDYQAFASAYGGGWSERLRLVQLPSCALTTPEFDRCRTQTPLGSRNSATDQTVSATVRVLAAPTSKTVLLAVTAAAAEVPTGAGDYSATPLSASSAWEAGGSSGSFTWSYPVDPARPTAGPTPSLSLSYDSGSTDGLNASTNNQGSTLGEGFQSAAQSYVERQYGGCEEDGHDKQYDLCWKYDNATLVLNGKATELVKDDTTGRWRLKNDDASVVLQGTGATNGDDNGEHWTVITGDGTKYVFGLDKLPGADTQRTNSVWSVPVFGDDSGEPGYTKGDAFADRWLTQAWRWNLDYVEDTHGNVMTYWYTAEDNQYRKNKATTANTKYTRSGYLTKILYGQRAGALFTADAPWKVDLAYKERCTAADCSELTESTAKNWPDVPFDAICSSGESDADCPGESPTFFTRKRLAQIETSVLTGTDYLKLDTWALSQRFLANGDIANSTDQSLVLESIRHTGQVGTPIKLDPVTFTYQMRPNRVAGGTQPGGGSILPLNRPRIETVTSETGAITTVSLNEPECVRGSNMPTAEDTNTKSCYPQYWNINGATEASLDWFHKYRVLAVNTADPVGTNDLVEYAYSYEGPAWHYNDSPFVPDDERTWSIWRGYQKVTVYTGALDRTRSKTVTTYMQGMNGDRKKDGTTRSATVPGIDPPGLNVPDLADSEPYAGFTRQQLVYDGDIAVSATVNDPWTSRTATQHKSYADVEAYYLRTGKTSTHTHLTVTGTWRTATTSTSHDSYGMPTKVDSTGDTAKTGDETCTRTWYARNDDGTKDTKGITSLASRTRTVSRTCATAEASLSLPANADTNGDLVSDTATVYDNPNTTAWSASQTPTKGEAAWTGRASAYPTTATNGERFPTSWQRTATTTFDTLGRPATVTDAAGNLTRSDYTPTGAGALTKTVVTVPKTQKTTTFYDGQRGLPLRTYDPNNKKTQQTYDALGRLTGVWMPNRSKDGGQSANTTYTYTLERGKAPSIATSTIKSSDTVSTSYEIFDATLRPLQKQIPTPQGGRLLTDTRYDSRGLAYETHADIFDNTTNPNSTYTRAMYGESPKQTNTEYDGAGRATTSTFRVYGIQKWSITTTYTGNSTAATAADGGQALRTITDALGRTVERREYAGTSPADPDFAGTGPGTPYTRTAFGYTADGRKSTVTGPDNAQWSYTYDLFGRETSAIDPDKGTTTTRYTALDQIDWTKDSSGHHLLYGYDVLGRKTDLWSKERSDGTKLAHWDYDTLAKGKLDASIRYDGGATGKAYTSRVLAYDDLYRATKTELTLDTEDSLVASGVVAPSYTTEQAYNLDGTLNSATEPAAGGLAEETVEFGYTTTGQVSSVSGTSGYLLSAGYSSLGQAERLVVGVSAAADAKRTYIDNHFEEGTDRLTRSLVTTPATSPYKPQDLAYTYDDAGNVIKIADTPNADTGLSVDTQCFTYDGYRRLTAAWTPAAGDCANTTAVLGGPAPYRSTYGYNSSGLRTTETLQSAGTTTSRTYCYNKPEQPHTLTATVTGSTCTSAPVQYEYDTAGNTTKRPGQSLTWNPEGRLDSVTEGTQKTGYLYDDDGTLLIRRAEGGGESVLYLGATEIHSKASGTTTKTWATRSYSAGGTVIAVRSNETGSQKVSFLASDAHGTSTIVLDATTQAVTRRYFTPFGTERGTGATGWPDDKAFLGKPADKATDLTHIGAREYDSLIGRFLSVDPLLETDKPQSLNGYTYAENNPVTWADPSGRGSIKCGGPGNPPCSPEVIASEETTAPPFTPTGNTKTNSGTSATSSSGNTCDAACLAAFYFRQWQVIKMQRERAALIAWRMGLGAAYQNPGIFEHMPGKDCKQKCLAKLSDLKADYFDQMSGPDTPTEETKHLDDVVGDVLSGIDSVNSKVESWAVGTFYYQLAKSTGAKCGATKDMIVCQTSLPIYGRGGTTVGHTYVTGTDPDYVSKERLKHERVHTEQWDEYGADFGPRYFSEGVDPCQNKYEKEAGWKDGGYPC
ncbi:RHS repeat-associated core domain-containing protein [Streptomyces sp. NPDC087263]|uniref:RHS repeat domain-containing protein n=1 Tax=Streptomyces sp. NPDC087263 TaxID=3365773 RepID=UPI003816B14E